MDFSCKNRAFCPSCLGKRMNEEASKRVDHVLPERVPIRQWVLTLPYPLCYPLVFDARHLSRVLSLFTDTVSAWYACHHPDSRTCAVTVIQRASSDLSQPSLPHPVPERRLPVGPENEGPVFVADPKPIQDGYQYRVTNQHDDPH